jgi:hypothetical protein
MIAKDSQFEKHQKLIRPASCRTRPNPPLAIDAVPLTSPYPAFTWLVLPLIMSGPFSVWIVWPPEKGAFLVSSA